MGKRGKIWGRIIQTFDQQINYKLLHNAGKDTLPKTTSSLRTPGENMLSSLPRAKVVPNSMDFHGIRAFLFSLVQPAWPPELLSCSTTPPVTKSMFSD
jgi:hypothetical protein